MKSSKPKIHYRAGFKYQLMTGISLLTPICGDWDTVHNQWVQLTSSGRLTISPGYAWDGASGPTKDTKDSMRASLIHDAFYQLMREGLLDLSYREDVDNYFWYLLREDGMNYVRAWYWWRAVRRFARRAAAGDPRPVEIAP
jgi:hypothetical protein